MFFFSLADVLTRQASDPHIIRSMIKLLLWSVGYTKIGQSPWIRSTGVAYLQRKHHRMRTANTDAIFKFSTTLLLLPLQNENISILLIAKQTKHKGYFVHLFASEFKTFSNSHSSAVHCLPTSNPQWFHLFGLQVTKIRISTEMIARIITRHKRKQNTCINPLNYRDSSDLGRGRAEPDSGPDSITKCLYIRHQFSDASSTVR